MDWLEFIANMVGILVWPIVLLVVLFALRRRIAEIFPQIVKLLPELRRLKLMGLEFEFDKAIRELKGSPGAKQLPTPDEVEKDPEFESLERIADISPRAALLEAWIKVESAAAACIERKGPGERPRGPTPPARLGGYLQQVGVLDQAGRYLYDELRILRNKAAHEADADFGPGVVRGYLDMALGLASRLRAAAEDA